MWFRQTATPPSQRALATRAGLRMHRTCVAGSHRTQPTSNVPRQGFEPVRHRFGLLRPRPAVLTDLGQHMRGGCWPGQSWRGRPTSRLCVPYPGHFPCIWNTSWSHLVDHPCVMLHLASVGLCCGVPAAFEGCWGLEIRFFGPHKGVTSTRER